MRAVVKGAAFGDGSWNGVRAKKVADLFDSMALEWKDRENEGCSIVMDSFDRIQFTTGRVLEVGCGTGEVLEVLKGYFDEAIGIDISNAMLRNSNYPQADQANCDGAHLPFPSASFDAVVIVNSLLFPSEVDRVLKVGGTCFFVSTKGAGTPIYLSPYDVRRVLGVKYQAFTSASGNGIWTALHKSA
jgi:ubiquinone/menaquinone biosynthesis C-methylase UbiE